MTLRSFPRAGKETRGVLLDSVAVLACRGTGGVSRDDSSVEVLPSRSLLDPSAHRLWVSERKVGKLFGINKTHFLKERPGIVTSTSSGRSGRAVPTAVHPTAPGRGCSGGIHRATGAKWCSDGAQWSIISTVITHV